MASVKWDLQAYSLDKQRKFLILSFYHKPCVEILQEAKRLLTLTLPPLEIRCFKRAFTLSLVGN